MLVITLKRRNKYGKIRFRLVGTYLAIIILTLVFISIYILTSISRYLYDEAKVNTLSTANIVANVVSPYVKTDNQKIQFALKQLNISDGIRIIVSDMSANVIYDTAVDNNLFGKIFINSEVISAIKGKDTVKIYDYDGSSVINCAVSVILDSENIGAVFISTATASTDDFINELKWILLVISVIVVFLVGVFSSVMADILIGPIEKLTGLIKQMESESLAGKVPVNGNDEIAQLSVAFNNLSDKLSDMEEKRRLFVSNASHELKTPLSSIKLLSESLVAMEPLDEEYVKEFMLDINGEIDRLTNIIDRLLQLTKLDANKTQMDKKVSDINEMSERIVKRLTPVAEVKSITLTLHTKQEVLALVDREKMWQVIYNITDNAIKYTPEGGVVNIFVFNEGDDCRVEIEDNGIGIPDSDINQVFDRFYRVDKARSRESGGTGLGLSIVHDLVKLHDGRVFCESKENHGTKFTVIIPKNVKSEQEDAL